MVADNRKTAPVAAVAVVAVTDVGGGGGGVGGAGVFVVGGIVVGVDGGGV